LDFRARRGDPVFAAACSVVDEAVLAHFSWSLKLLDIKEVKGGGKEIYMNGQRGV
jgi:hypothetical protein